MMLADLASILGECWIVCIMCFAHCVCRVSPGIFGSGLPCWVPRALRRVSPAAPRTTPLVCPTGTPARSSRPAARWSIAAAATAAAAAATWPTWTPTGRLVLPRRPAPRPRAEIVIPRPWPTPFWLFFFAIMGWHLPYLIFELRRAGFVLFQRLYRFGSISI